MPRFPVALLGWAPIYVFLIPLRRRTMTKEPILLHESAQPTSLPKGKMSISIFHWSICMAAGYFAHSTTSIAHNTRISVDGRILSVS
jgi:hypothetical protein